MSRHGDIDESHPFNVLVLGRSQQGKSTFIKKLRSLAEVRTGQEPVEGKGTFRETTEVASYDLKLSTTPWKLTKPNNGASIRVPRDEGKVLDHIALLKPSEATVVAEDEDAPRITLRLIDTPGLDDNKGEDAKHIHKVLQFLTEMAQSEDPTLHYLSAILIVVKDGSPFSDVFQRIYRYYERCMPNLFRGVAIINTSFTLTAWQAAYELQMNAFSTLAATKSAKVRHYQQRQKAFLETFGQHRRHFFVDSKPNTKYPFEEFTTRNTIADILSFIASQGDMPVKEMQLFKFPAWIAIDEMLIDWLGSARRSFEDRKARLLVQASEEVKERTFLSETKTKLEESLAAVEEKLARIDTDTQYTLQVRSTDEEEHSIWNIAGGIITTQGIQGTMQIQEDVEMFRVTAINSPQGRWLHTGMDDANTWVGAYRGNLGRYPSLEARSWTTNRIYYANEISKLKAEKDELGYQLRDATRISEYQETRVINPEDNERDVKRLGEHVAACRKLIESLRSDEVPMSQTSTKTAMRRYLRKDHTYVRPTDLYRLIKLESREFRIEIQLLDQLFRAENQVVGGDSEVSEDEDDYEEDPKPQEVASEEEQTPGQPVPSPPLELPVLPEPPAGGQQVLDAEEIRLPNLPVPIVDSPRKEPNGNSDQVSVLRNRPREDKEKSCCEVM